MAKIIVDEKRMPSDKDRDALVDKLITALDMEVGDARTKAAEIESDTFFSATGLAEKDIQAIADEEGITYEQALSEMTEEYGAE